MATAAVRPALPVEPLQWRSLALWMLPWAILAMAVYNHNEPTFISWYATGAWTPPLGIALIGLCGGVVGNRLTRAELAKPDPGKINDPLDVVVTTLGNYSLMGALTRVAESLDSLRANFTNLASFIVIDEGKAEAAEAIERLCIRLGITLLVVPRDWQTPNGTEFKGRAECYALEERRRLRGGVTPDNHHTYCLDDDTAADPSTSRSLATFIKENRGAEGIKVAQGILVFRREDSKSWLMWMIDAIRPGDDKGRFAWSTGRGKPRNGMHGENRLFRTSVMEKVGLDVGPRELVEDSRLALKLCRNKIKTAWITARCFGSSPETAADFLKQRVRWAEGMFKLAFFSREATLRDRVLLMHNMLIWGLGVFQPAVVVFAVAWLIKEHNIAPVSPWVAVVWIISVSYTCWIYYAGLYENARASGRKHPRVIDLVALLPVIFLVASPLEGLAGTIGCAKCLLRYTPLFPVIAKSA